MEKGIDKLAIAQINALMTSLYNRDETNLVLIGCNDEAGKEFFCAACSGRNFGRIASCMCKALYRLLKKACDQEIPSKSDLQKLGTLLTKDLLSIRKMDRKGTLKQAQD